MKPNLGIINCSNDSETFWNAFRIANFSLTQKDIIKIFLLAKGVGAKTVIGLNLMWLGKWKFLLPAEVKFWLAELE